MNHLDEELRKAVALFRYGLIADVLRLPPGSRDIRRALHEKAQRTYIIPGTRRTRVAVETMRDWLSLYRTGGFEALYPRTHADRGQPRRLPPEVAELLVSLKTEQPALSVKSLIGAARERGVDHPLAPSTVHRLLAREGLLDKRPGDPLATDRRRFAFLGLAGKPQPLRNTDSAVVSPSLLLALVERCPMHDIGQVGAHVKVGSPRQVLSGAIGVPRGDRKGVACASNEHIAEPAEDLCTLDGLCPAHPLVDLPPRAGALARYGLVRLLDLHVPHYRDRGHCTGDARRHVGRVLAAPDSFDLTYDLRKQRRLVAKAVAPGVIGELLGSPPTAHEPGGDGNVVDSPPPSRAATTAASHVSEVGAIPGSSSRSAPRRWP